jgi:dinuclear metal center YbgI/SA1388 family protein
MANRDEIVRFLDERLEIRKVQDRSSNGLQVAGRAEVQKLAVATDAAMATYERAAAEGCDMLLVHHGLIWGGIQYVTHRNHRHLKFLLERDLNLYAAHLPLDLHPEIGNNALLAKGLGLAAARPFGDYHGERIGISGELARPLTAPEIADRLATLVGGAPKILPFGPASNRTVAVVSGAGGSTFTEAAEAGVDCFVTGEASHQIFHEAREGGVNVVLLGHYLSETIGVRALGGEASARFGVPAIFIDEPTGF